MVTLRKVTVTHLAPSVGAELLVHVRRWSPIEACSNKVPPAAQYHACQIHCGPQNPNTRLTRWDTLGRSHAM